MTFSGLLSRAKFPLIFVTVTGMIFVCVVYSEFVFRAPTIRRQVQPVNSPLLLPTQPVYKSPSSSPSCQQCSPVNSVTGTLVSPHKVQFVHQSWKVAKLPPRFQKWSESWKVCFPNSHYIMWTDDDNRHFIAQHYPWFLKRYDNLPSPIYRADAVRYLYLFHYGGIYSDLDNECLRPFDHLLLNSSIVFGAMSGYKNVDEGYVQNSFMYSIPRHPMWLELLMQIVQTTSNNIAPENLTGPGALVKIINAYRKRLNSSKEITVYPPHYFNPFSWQKNKIKACKHFNHMSDAELIQCRDAHRNTSFVIQYHTHTWGGGKIL